MQVPPDAPIQRYLISEGDDFTGYWVRTLGWIAYYFSQLEGVSYRLVDALAHEDKRTQLMRLPFQARTEAAKDLVASYFASREQRDASAEWAGLLEDIKNAAPLRNAILHNPFTTNMLKTGAIKEEDEGIVLMRQVGQPVMKLGAVQVFCAHVVELNQRMLRLSESAPLPE